MNISDMEEYLASTGTKVWWKKYMKGIISFRGVGIPKNRELLALWRKENGINNWFLEKQLELALTFFHEPIAEDKLTGILFLQNYLCDHLSWEIMLNRYEDIYAKALIFDWNICDWFCMRVLGPTIKKYGRSCAQTIASWKNRDSLWQARSSVVAFVKIASESAYYPLIRAACTVLIRREERFSKTAVGWILRDISKHDQRFVKTFIWVCTSFPGLPDVVGSSFLTRYPHTTCSGKGSKVHTQKHLFKTMQ